MAPYALYLLLSTLASFEFAPAAASLSILPSRTHRRHHHVHLSRRSAPSRDSKIERRQVSRWAAEEWEERETAGMVKRAVASSLPTTLAATSCTIGRYGQCGGFAWTGNTCCTDGWTCAYQNLLLSQCVPPVSTTTVATSTETTSTSAAAARTSTAPTKASVAGFSYAGCYSDAIGARSLPNMLTAGTWTATACLAAVYAAGYAYGGIIYGGECWGADALASTAVALPVSSCLWTCNDDRTSYCGGEAGLDVYQRVPAKVNSIVGASHAGCYSDSIATRSIANLVTTPVWTASACILAVKAKGYKLAALETGGECWGADTLAATATVLTADQCTYTCNDAKFEQCGGSNAIDIYILT